MRMGQWVRTGLGHGGITCALQTQFSCFNQKRHPNMAMFYGALHLNKRCEMICFDDDLLLMGIKINTVFLFLY